MSHQLSRSTLLRAFSLLAAALPASGFATALAEPAAVPVAGTTTLPDPFATTGLLQLTLALAAIVAVIFALGWVMRRWSGISSATPADLRIVGTLPLGQRERIVLLQAGEEQLLVGISPGRIQTLHVLDNPIAVPAAGAPAASFGSLLATLERRA